MEEKAIQERVNWLNSFVPEGETELTYMDCGDVEYLVFGPEPDDEERDTGEWNDRILAVNEYKHDYGIEDFLSGAEQMVYMLTGKSN